MNKGEFQTHIRTIINRDDTPLAIIDAATTMAISFIENNYNLEYMKQFIPRTIPSTVLEYPIGQDIKRIMCARINDPDNPGADYIPLRQVDPEEIKNTPGVGTVPTWFFLAPGGANPDVDGSPIMIHFGTLGWPKIYLLELFVYSRTSGWSGLAADATHWLIDNALDWLTARTMVYLAPILRQPEILAIWKALEQESLQALLNANNELVQSARDERMGYTGEVVP